MKSKLACRVVSVQRDPALSERERTQRLDAVAALLVDSFLSDDPMQQFDEPREHQRNLERADPHR